MAPTTPRTAYNLYFRYYKNMFKNPSLRFKGITSNRNALKDFIRTVLKFDPEVISVTDDSETRKYMGTKSFTGMSKKVGEEWKKVDELTRSVFKELAEEESERYKKASPYLHIILPFGKIECRTDLTQCFCFYIFAGAV